MKTVREMNVDEVGYTTPWQCVLNASGVIEAPEEATIESTGAGTRCIEVIKTNDGIGIGRFASEITGMQFSDLRRFFKRQSRTA